MLTPVTKRSTPELEELQQDLINTSLAIATKQLEQLPFDEQSEIYQHCQDHILAEHAMRVRGIGYFITEKKTGCPF